MPTIQSSAPAAPASVGDTAAMRHVIEAAIRDLESNLELTRSQYGLNNRDYMIKYLKAALAKPSRNCDMFGGDYKMLHTAWFDWTGSPSGQNPDGTVKMTFPEWLLAPVDAKLAKCESEVPNA